MNFEKAIQIFSKNISYTPVDVQIKLCQIIGKRMIRKNFCLEGRIDIWKLFEPVPNKTLCDCGQSKEMMNSFKEAVYEELRFQAIQLNLKRFLQIYHQYLDENTSLKETYGLLGRIWVLLFIYEWLTSTENEYMFESIFYDFILHDHCCFEEKIFSILGNSVIVNGNMSFVKSSQLLNLKFKDVY